MNEIVAKFIEKQKEKQNQQKKIQKEKHLLELGLIDEKLSEKQYARPSMNENDAKEWGYKYQDAYGLYKIIKGVPLDISDEDYDEICKICPPSNGKIIANNESNVSAETILRACAWILLVLGIIAGFSMMVQAGNHYSFNWNLFGIGIGTMLTSIMTSGFALVITNISRKIDSLNK